MTVNYCVRRQAKLSNPCAVGEQVEVFTNYEDAAKFVEADFKKNGKTSLYVSAIY